MFNNRIQVQLFTKLFEYLGYKFNEDKINIIGIRSFDGTKDHAIVIYKDRDWYQVDHYTKVNTSPKEKDVQPGQYDQRISKLVEMDLSMHRLSNCIYTLVELQELLKAAAKLFREAPKAIETSHNDI